MIIHLEAIANAIDRAYRDMRQSEFANLDPRGRDVSVDIDVQRGSFAVLAQRVGRAGTVEAEYDDTVGEGAGANNDPGLKAPPWFQKFKLI